MATRTRIRRATEGDLGELVRLLGILFSLESDFRPDSRRQRRGLRAMLAEPERRLVLVAARGGAVVGMVTLQLVISTAEGGPAGLLEDLVVDEVVRGEGIGRRLLRAAERWGRAKGATRLQLLADAGNRPALGFYARMGWGGTKLVCLRRGGSLGVRRAASGQGVRRP